MSGIAVYGNHLFIIVALPNRKSLVGFRFEGFNRWVCSYSSSISGPKFLARASSASSFPPLSGDYSELLLGAKPKEKTQRISDRDQEEIEDPRLIADSDSCFCDFNGVQLHHKICDTDLSPSDTVEEGLNNVIERVYFPMVLLHGFGSSVFSWNQIMKPLARITRSKVLAFDRPAFGLTSRVNIVDNSSPVKADSASVNPYSMMFSVLATLFFMDFLDAEKVILVGHSAGSLVAVDTYFDAPERVAALILVAPAILAPFFMQNVSKDNQVRSDNQIKANSIAPVRLFLQLLSILLKFTKSIAEVIVSMVKGAGDTINSLYNKALSAILRSTFGVLVIRMIINKFGIPAIRAAWCDSNQVSDDVLQGYTKPLKVKGWDKALVEYTVAMLTDSASTLKLPLAKRLKDISCPGSCLEIIKNCGHLPQEEKAEEFVSVVHKFLQRVFGVADEARLLAMT